MTFILHDKATAIKLNNALSRASQQSADSLAKLSSGKVFTSHDPRPADRALAEGLEQKLRSLAASKRNVNDAVSLLQTAEAGFSEISNMLVRMKEINTAAASTTISDRERKFLFVEYRALFDEIDRIAQTTEFNGIPLLNGDDAAVPERLVFRVGDTVRSEDAPSQDSDWNALSFDNLKQIVATTVGLGLKPVGDLLAEAEADGISVDDALELMESDDRRYASIYDEAMQQLSEYRASYGAMQNRLHKVMDYQEVATENIAAAKSRIADVDYASEVARLTQSNILLQTTTALMTQSRLASGLTLNLINSLLQ